MSQEKQESKLIRNLGFWDLMGIAVGQIIGAGIMTTTGVALGMTGTGVVLAYLMSPILTLITIYPAAMLGSSVPVTGGQYRYVSRLLGKAPGTMYLLLYTFTNITISLYALSFAQYAASIFPDINQRLVAIIMLTVFYLANLKGTKTAAILNTALSVMMIGGLGIFIIFGLPEANFGYVFNTNNLFMNGSFMFISSLALLSSATGGAQVIAELGGETKNPGKTIPKVMILSTLGVGVVYVLVAIAASGVLPIEAVKNQPLSVVAKQIMPYSFFLLFVIGAAGGATTTTLNATLSWITKPLLVACEDGILPKSLASVSKNGVPYKLLTIFYFVGLTPLVLGANIAFVAKLGTANSLLTKAFVCLALTRLVKKYPKQAAASALNITESKAKIHGYLAIVILVILSSSLLLNLTKPTLIFLVCCVVATALYAKFKLKNVTIPDDLAIDYTTKNEESQTELDA